MHRNTVRAAIDRMLKTGILVKLSGADSRSYLAVKAPGQVVQMKPTIGTTETHPEKSKVVQMETTGGTNGDKGGSQMYQNGTNGGPEGTTPLKVQSEGTSFKREALPKKATSKKRFQKPSVEQVSAYMISRGFDIGKASDQAEAFVDHFEANGWRIGGRAPMKNWRAAVRTWIRNADRWTMSAKPDANKLPRDPALDEDKNPNWWAACL